MQNQYRNGRYKHDTNVNSKIKRKRKKKEKKLANFASAPVYNDVTKVTKLDRKKENLG